MERCQRPTQTFSRLSTHVGATIRTEWTFAPVWSWLLALVKPRWAPQVVPASPLSSGCWGHRRKLPSTCTPTTGEVAKYSFLGSFLSMFGTAPKSKKDPYSPSPPRLCLHALQAQLLSSVPPGPPRRADPTLQSRAGRSEGLAQVVCSCLRFRV